MDSSIRWFQCLIVGDICETNIDDCETNPCENGGECHDGIDVYTCECTSDWMGETCEEVNVHDMYTMFSNTLQCVQFVLNCIHFLIHSILDCVTDIYTKSIRCSCTQLYLSYGRGVKCTICTLRVSVCCERPVLILLN